MERVLVTGGAGFLGQALLRAAPPGLELHATAREAEPPACPAAVHRLDLSDPAAVQELVEGIRPSLLVHTAFRLSGPRLERDTLDAARAVAAAAAGCGARLLHLSSDALFAGRPRPYVEDDPPEPVHAYGRAKAAAEGAVRAAMGPGRFCMIRTSLLTSADPWDPRSAWIVETARAGREVPLFTDEVRCPIGVDDLAAALWEVARWQYWPPVLHVAGPEALTRFELGLRVLARAGLPAALARPASNAGGSERRPGDVRLDSSLALSRLSWRPRPIVEVLAGPA